MTAAYHVVTDDVVQDPIRRRFALFIARHDPSPETSRSDGQEGAMPRAPSTEPERQRHQQRQQRYRARLREAGQPEADAVDAALAAAIVGVATDERAAEQQDAVLKGYLSALLKRARRELVDRGYERERATAALQRRLNRVTG